MERSSDYGEKMNRGPELTSTREQVREDSQLSVGVRVTGNTGVGEGESGSSRAVSISKRGNISKKRKRQR